MITIDGKEHDPETFEGEAKVHYEQAMAIREQLGQISNQIGQLQQAGLNLQVALSWREQSLISAVTASEDDDEEAA
jgi:hypothetical protein